MAGTQKEPSNSFQLYCAARFFQKPSSQEREDVDLSDSKKKPPQKKPIGWRAMPYILGNETFERIATIGLLANFMIYLVREFHMNQASAANILNIWGCITNFEPLLGALICDTYNGGFKTIAFASIASILDLQVFSEDSEFIKVCQGPFFCGIKVFCAVAMTPYTNLSRSVVMIPDLRLDSSYLANTNRVLSSLLRFQGEEWEFPPSDKDVQN